MSSLAGRDALSEQCCVEERTLTITRDIEVKNNLTIARGEWGGDSEERGLQELL